MYVLKYIIPGSFYLYLCQGKHPCYSVIARNCRQKICSEQSNQKLPELVASLVLYNKKIRKSGRKQEERIKKKLLEIKNLMEYL